MPCQATTSSGEWRASAAHKLPMDAETLTLALKSLPLDVRLSKNTLDGFKTYSIPLLVAQKRIPAAFDPAPAVDNRFVAAAMKADPSAFADLKEIPAAQRL